LRLCAFAPLRLSTACPSVLKSSRKCAFLHYSGTDFMDSEFSRSAIFGKEIQQKQTKVTKWNSSFVSFVSFVSFCSKQILAIRTAIRKSPSLPQRFFLPRITRIRNCCCLPSKFLVLLSHPCNPCNPWSIPSVAALPLWVIRGHHLMQRKFH
jgi:hypothetical protein